MSSVGLMAQFQDAYVAAIEADAACQAVFGTGFDIYEDVPPNANLFPYVALGEDQKIPVLAECLSGSEVYITFHVWSRNGLGEVKQGADAIEDCLHEANLQLPDFTLVTIERKGSRFLKDPDGITTHAVVTFRALVNPRA